MLRIDKNNFKDSVEMIYESMIRTNKSVTVVIHDYISNYRLRINEYYDHSLLNNIDFNNCFLVYLNVLIHQAEYDFSHLPRLNVEDTLTYTLPDDFCFETDEEIVRYEELIRDNVFSYIFNRIDGIDLSYQIKILKLLMKCNVYMKEY